MSSHRQALTVAPQRVEAQTAWGRFLSMQQRFHEAEAALQPAITLNSRAIAPHLALGDLYLRGLGKFQVVRQSAIVPVASGRNYHGLHPCPCPNRFF